MLSATIQRVKINGLRALHGEAGAALLNAAAMAVVAQSIGPAQFGVLALYMAYSELVGRFCFPQCWEALTRFAGADQASLQVRLPPLYKICLRMDTAGSLLGVTACLACLPLFLRLGGLEDSSPAVGLLLCLLPLGWAADSTIGALRLLDKFDYYSKAQWTAGIFKLGLVSLAAAFWPHLLIMTVAYVASTLIGAALKLHYASRAMREAGMDMRCHPLSLREAKHMGLLSFAWNQHLNVSLRAIAVRLDVLVLGYFASTSTVGAYRVATYLGSLLSSVTVPLLAAYYPEAVRLAAAKHRRSLLLLTLACCGAAFGIGVAATLAFSALGQWFIALVLGVQYNIVYSIGIIYLGAITLALGVTPLYSLTLALGEARVALISQAFAVSGFGIALVLATKVWGAYGAALSHYAYYGIWLITTCIFLRRSFAKNELG